MESYELMNKSLFTIILTTPHDQTFTIKTLINIYEFNNITKHL
jgi:hypothetical protein